MNKVLGIDVGGTGIKGAIIDVNTGKLLTERLKLKTNHPATPKSVGKQIKELLEIHGYGGNTVGIGFPSVIKGKHSLTASNVDDSWIDFPITDHFSNVLGKKVYVLNDADAAGLAENTFSSNIKQQGLTVFLTVGTGIGSAFFYNGVLVPNTEFGHINFQKSYAEKYVSNYAKESKDLSWKEWGTLFNAYLEHLEFILRPDNFIIGGGISKKMDKYRKYLKVNVPISSATLLNEAGVIGAALAADKKLVF